MMSNKIKVFGEDKAERIAGIFLPYTILNMLGWDEEEDYLMDIAMTHDSLIIYKKEKGKPHE